MHVPVCLCPYLLPRVPAAAPCGTCPLPAALDDGMAVLESVGGGGIVVAAAAAEDEAEEDCGPGCAVSRPAGIGRGPLAKGTMG